MILMYEKTGHDFIIKKINNHGLKNNIALANSLESKKPNITLYSCLELPYLIRDADITELTSSYSL